MSQVLPQQPPQYRNALTALLARTPGLYVTVRSVYFALSQPRATAKRLYRHMWRSGIFIEPSELAMCSLLPRATLDAVMERFHPASVLDVGAGTGQSVAYFVAHGVEAVGLEGSALAIAHSAHPERMLQRDLRRSVDLGRRFDLVWSYEVAEHIHRRHVDVFLSTLTRHGDRIVMSAARPGQGGEGHFNEQPPEYWVDRMRALGFELDGETTHAFGVLPDEFSANLLVFNRRASSTGLGSATGERRGPEGRRMRG